MILVVLVAVLRVCGNCRQLTKAKSQQRSLNQALEAVLELSNNQNSPDLHTLDKVQTFLNKVKNEIMRKKKYRRSYRVLPIFTNFIKNTINILNGYSNEDLEEFVTIVEDEIKKYYYRDSKFSEIMDNADWTDFLFDKLDQMRAMPGAIIRDEMNMFLDTIQYDDLGKNLFSKYVDSVYSPEDVIKLTKVLGELSNYKRKTKRSSLDLINIVRNGFRSVFFDHYSNLEHVTRVGLRSKLESLWVGVSNGQNLTMYDQISSEDSFEHQHFRRFLSKEQNTRFHKKLQKKEFVERDDIGMDLNRIRRERRRQRMKILEASKLLTIKGRNKIWKKKKHEIRKDHKNSQEYIRAKARLSGESDEHTTISSAVFNVHMPGFAAFVINTRHVTSKRKLRYRTVKRRLEKKKTNAKKKDQSYYNPSSSEERYLLKKYKKRSRGYEKSDSDSTEGLSIEIGNRTARKYNYNYNKTIFRAVDESIKITSLDLRLKDAGKNNTNDKKPFFRAVDESTTLAPLNLTTDRGEENSDNDSHTLLRAANESKIISTSLHLKMDSAVENNYNESNTLYSEDDETITTTPLYLKTESAQKHNDNDGNNLYKVNDESTTTKTLFDLRTQSGKKDNDIDSNSLHRPDDDPTKTNNDYNKLYRADDEVTIITTSLNLRTHTAEDINDNDSKSLYRTDDDLTTTTSIDMRSQSDEKNIENSSKMFNRDNDMSRTTTSLDLSTDLKTGKDKIVGNYTENAVEKPLFYIPYYVDSTTVTKNTRLLSTIINKVTTTTIFPIAMNDTELITLTPKLNMSKEHMVFYFDLDNTENIIKSNILEKDIEEWLYRHPEYNKVSKSDSENNLCIKKRRDRYVNLYKLKSNLSSPLIPRSNLITVAETDNNKSRKNAENPIDKERLIHDYVTNTTEIQNENIKHVNATENTETKEIFIEFKGTAVEHDFAKQREQENAVHLAELEAYWNETKPLDEESERLKKQYLKEFKIMQRSIDKSFKPIGKRGETDLEVSEEKPCKTCTLPEFLQ